MALLDVFGNGNPALRAPQAADAPIDCAEAFNCAAPPPRLVPDRRGWDRRAHARPCAPGPRLYGWSSSSALGLFRAATEHRFERDRWFESTFLQRGVRCEPDPLLWLGKNQLRTSIFAVTGSRRSCCSLPLSVIYARSRNCGPPNSIRAVNLASPLLDAALR
jgi:hypothetical protein